MRLSFAYSNRAQHQSTLAEITARQLSALNSEGGEFCLGLDGRPIFLNNNMSETIIVLYGGRGVLVGKSWMLDGKTRFRRWRDGLEGNGEWSV